VFADVFGVDEDDVLAAWTVERFERFRRYADAEMRRRGVTSGR
jgi:hypothetical protein